MICSPKFFSHAKMTLVAGHIGRLRVHGRTEKLVTDPLGLVNWRAVSDLPRLLPAL
jgi:hypothetical protein